MVRTSQVPRCKNLATFAKHISVLVLNMELTESVFIRQCCVAMMVRRYLDAEDRGALRRSYIIGSFRVRQRQCDRMKEQ